MKINKTANHPAECENCRNIITTDEYRFLTDFGGVVCFGCKRKERKTSFMSKLLNWLGK